MTWSSVDELRFEIAKRIHVWSYIGQLPASTDATSPLGTSLTRTVSAAERARLNTTCQQLVQLAAHLKQDPVTASWVNYLGLYELNEALSDGEIDAHDADLVRVILRRTVSAQLTQPQLEYLATPPISPVLNEVRYWIEPAPSAETLLREIETYERAYNPAAELRLSRSIESLLWSTDPAEVQLGDQLETNYRNANLRFTVSESMLNRMVPQNMMTNEPVNDRVLGARVTGISQTENRLRVRLVPDAHRWFLGLEAQGVVSSRTRAFKDGIIFHDHGTATFEANKLSLARSPWNRFTDASAIASDNNDGRRKRLRLGASARESGSCHRHATTK
ncbi:MAG: hypothetical protein R3B96_12890 [Pirellulaceae bacterium]